MSIKLRLAPLRDEDGDVLLPYCLRSGFHQAHVTTATLTIWNKEHPIRDRRYQVFGPQIPDLYVSALNEIGRTNCGLRFVGLRIRTHRHGDAYGGHACEDDAMPQSNHF